MKPALPTYRALRFQLSLARKAFLLFYSAISMAALCLFSYYVGYYASLLPLSLLTPLVILAFVLFPVVIFFIALGLLFVGKEPILSRIAFFLVITTIIILPFLLPVPSKMEGFKARMSTYTPAQWNSFAREAQAIASQHNDRYNLLMIRELSHEISETLSPIYPFLKLGDWPPLINVRDDEVNIRWGSGLVGTLGIEIRTDSASHKRNFHNPSDRIQLYPGIFLYD